MKNNLPKTVLYFVLPITIIFLGLTCQITIILSIKISSKEQKYNQ